MKAPWTKAVDKLSSKTELTFVQFRKHLEKKIEERYLDSQKNYKIFTRSEQLKHNDHKRRLAVLEEILKDEVQKLHERNLSREVRAAEDAEE
jgi:hypothetical protein